jgi:translation initiation factor 5B
MPPKKKGNKKAQADDWEAELGESIPPQSAATDEPKVDEDAPADEAAGGGLMAALQRRGKKKKNKGADFELEGEDPTADGANGADAPAEVDLASKAPQEATFDDDDDDVFAGNYGKKKGKGGAAAAAAAAEKQEEPQAGQDDGAPRVKTKAEKEKEKKEKEKQRKKELVSLRAMDEFCTE